MFNKLLCLGFGVCFLFQVFLSIGGVTKFIPSTGVTIPLVSYGGTSVISTLIILNIVQGLYMLADSEEEEYERIKAEEAQRQQNTEAYTGPNRRTRVKKETKG